MKNCQKIQNDGYDMSQIEKHIDWRRKGRKLKIAKLENWKMNHENDVKTSLNFSVKIQINRFNFNTYFNKGNPKPHRLKYSKSKTE